MTAPATTYVELQATSHFSFLRGASSPEELFAAASLLGHSALGLCDRGSVAGMVRGLSGQEATGVRMIAGSRVDLRDGRSLLLYPKDRAAWSRLTRLLSLGKARGGKGNCWLDWPDIAAWAEGLVAILVPGEADERTRLDLGELRETFGLDAYLALSLRRRPGDFARLRALDALASDVGVRPVATGDILFHAPDRRPLQDVLTAIREKTTIDALGFKRERFMDRALKSPAEMERRFALFPDAIAASADIAAACRFDLAEIKYQYPYEEVMAGRTAQEALAALAEEGAARMFPDGVPPAYRKQIDHELRLIGELGYAPYFLTVNSIVAESRRRGILCQGRGSAANSCVCFLLGVTSIDPIKHELLFERFVSGERKEPPDIDVDFEHERREEIIQWIYETYGRHRSALTAVVTRYRTRGAVAEVGKALGLPRDLTKMLTGLVWGWSMDGIPEERIAELNLNADDHRLRLTLDLARQLIGTPRHLSQHPGGFVLTEERLDDLVPIEPARMEDRQIIEWDKDDIDVLKFMKVDVLGLGMLGCMNRAFNLLREHKGISVGMADLQDDDPAVYGMIQKADTLGVFQIESRAQMSMLPRIKPKCFYDLVIEVAIVRPGPIQGDMVHPYLRRREGKEKPEYPKPELRAVLEKTLGVPLFQEQAMKVAIVGAGFTPVEADQLRRAMATFKLTGGVSHFYDKLVGGMVERGYPKDFAERTFKQIEGFGSYGFPESHAASFAKIAYASCWMKHHHPDVFCAALLNAQPMGFYAPAQIVRDAQKHGVEVRPVSINDSHWDCTLEETDGRYLAVRLGLRQVRSLANIHGAAIVGARGDLPYDCVEDVWRRAGVPRAAIERIAEADGFACLAEDRRQGLWKVRGLGEAPLPLFAAADAREASFSPEGLEPAAALRPMTEGREVVEDYRTLQLSLRAHPLSFLREELDAMGIVRCADLPHIRDGRNIEVAGVILVRQRPGSAKGVLFVTIEDETGIANGILWPDRFDIYRRPVMSASMIAMRGRLQKEGEVSRFFRDHFELEFYVRKLAKNGVKLVSITQEIGDDPVHVMMRQIMALFDEYQSKENAKHTLRAMKENARQGFWNGAQPPIGYRLVVAAQRGERIKKKLEIDPLHADTVRLIFRLAQEGVGDGPMGVKMIVNHLNENRIRTRSGGLWGVGAVHQILTRRTYFGIHEFNRLAKGKRPNDKADIVTIEVPPIISEDCFNAVQTRLRARSPARLNPAIAASPSLLTGVLHCAECGGSMTVMTGKGGRYRYYACANRRRKGAVACSAGIIRTELLENVVSQYIEKRLLDPVRLGALLSSLLDQREERAKEREQRVAELGRKAAEAQQRLARLYAAIESGAADLDDPDLANRIATLKATRDQAQVDAERAEALMDSSGAKSISPELLAEFTKRVKKRLRGSNGKYRRDHFHQFAQRVEILKRKIRIGGTKESLFNAVFALGNVKQKDLVPSAVLKWLPG